MNCIQIILSLVFEGLCVSNFFALQNVEKCGVEDVEDELTDEEAMVTEGERSVLVVSDSPSSPAEKHKPVQEEEELASLLLAKSPLDLADMVAFYEDLDYPFFEKVLLAILKCKL